MLTLKSRKLQQLLEFPAVENLILDKEWNIIGSEKSEPVVSIPAISNQTTESEGHRKNQSGSYDSGGPFYTFKANLFVRSKHIKFVGKKAGNPFVGAYRYSGPTFPLTPTELVADLLAVLPVGVLRSKDLSDLDPFGTTAIAQCSPVNPVDTLGQGITETYRDGLPSLPGIRTWKRRTQIAKAAADEFLNAVFGWEPLVSEVKDFASTVQNSRDLLMQYHKNQGTDVRRSFEFPVSDESASGIIKTKASAFAAGLGGNGSSIEKGPYGWQTPNEGNVIRTISRKKVMRFVGSFTYAVPSQSDSWRRMLGYGTDADKLFGIALTPELLWNIAPWSWAVDWFSNAGDVITNISNFIGAGQIMRYGYMMEEDTITVTYTMDRSSFFIEGTEIQAPSLEYRQVSKVRRPADPYGFSVSIGSLSPLQIAIAAALGISLL